VVGIEWITSTSTAPPFHDRSLVYDMPLVYDHLEKKNKKVSTLKTFLRSFLELMKDEPALSIIH